MAHDVPVAEVAMTGTDTASSSAKRRRVRFDEVVEVLEFARLLGGSGGVPTDGTWATLGLGEARALHFGRLGLARDRARILEEYSMMRPGRCWTFWILALSAAERPFRLQEASLAATFNDSLLSRVTPKVATLKAREDEMEQISKVSKEESRELREAKEAAQETNAQLDTAVVSLGAHQALAETQLEMQVLQSQVEKLRRKRLQFSRQTSESDSVRLAADALEKANAVHRSTAMSKAAQGKLLARHEAALADDAEEEWRALRVMQGLTYLEGKHEKILQDDETRVKDYQVQLNRVERWKDSARHLKEVAGEVAAQEQKVASEAQERRQRLETMES
eukprot:s337_g4.t1